MESGRLQRLAAIWLLVAIGFAGLVIPTVDMLADGLSTPLDVLGILTPLLLALPVWDMAYWTRQNVSHSTDALVVSAWCLGFTLAAALITGAAILVQAASGVYIHEPLLLVNNIGVVGSVLGVIVGYFHATTRRRSRAHATSRDRLAEQKRHLLFLNRLLRHDISNDVAVIHGYAELLTDEYPDEPDLETILRKSEEIEELTALARDLSEPAVDTSNEAVLLAPAIEDAAEQVRNSFPEATVRVKDIPIGLSVQANAMLPAVFQNILRNAIQHNDNPTPEVTAKVETTEETVQVSLTDNGPGIPEAVKQDLFQAGQKGLESTGSGLGLYLVETLVASYDGDIWIANGESSGTTVVIELPRPN